MDSTANLINKISDDLIISRKIHDCYLMYTSKEYYLFKPIDNVYVPISIDISENPDIVETTLLDGAKGKLSNNPTFNGSLQFLKLHLEMIGLTAETQQDFLNESFYDLAEIYVKEKDRITNFKEINNEKLIADIITISKDVERNKQDSVIGELYITFKNRKGVKKGQRTLGNYLNKEQGIILRKHSHERYKLDKNLNGYDSIDNDEIIELLADIFGEDNLISTSDVETAVDFISERLSPTPDIVKFNNALYDMKQHKIIKPEKPIFTLVESPYNYNPDAKGEIIQEFLKSSLKREDDKETKRLIKGFLQVLGYLFTSGNSYNVLVFLTGVSGGGKGTILLIIGDIFRGKTCSVDINKINNDKQGHTSSTFINSHLNLVAESKPEIVYDNTEYKTLSGNDPYPVNPKFQDPYLLPKEEVPKSVIANNNLPTFANPDVGLLQRFLVVEFKNVFRNTKNDIKNLADIIINSADDMEWLIYHGLEEYKKMVEANEDFELRLSEKETGEILFKHSKPLNYLISKLILKHDAEALESEVAIYNDNGETKFTTPYIINDELNQLVRYLAKKEGVQLTLDEKNGKVSPTKLLKVIKDEFDLNEYYLKTSNGSSKKYTTIQKRIDGEVKRIYPELVKTDYYNELLQEMNKELADDNETKDN